MKKTNLGLIPLNLLGESFVSGVCKNGKPKDHCRYFSTCDVDGSPACLKLTNFREDIDKEVDLFLNNVAYDAHDLPIGDNCLGCAPALATLLE